MAKPGKLSTNLLAEFSSEKAKRPFGNLPPRRYYLIVCEGEETESNYFDAIKKILPPEMVNRITITGTGRNTMSLVEYAQKEVDKRRESDRPPYHNIWVVFDRDSFNADDFDNAISSIESKSTETEIWQAAWSNEAFELWYILHFRDQTGGSLHRQDYQDILAEEMHRPYEKNAKDMFDLLKPYVVKAIKRANAALKQQKGKAYHEQNPATTVQRLVKELLSYIPSTASIPAGTRQSSPSRKRTGF